MLTIGLAALILGACGGSSGRDAPPDPSPPPPPPPPPPPITFAVTLSGEQEVPPVDSAARGTAELQIEPGTGALSGMVEVEDMDATEAHIHDGHAGSNGPILVHLVQDPSDPNRFGFAPSAALSPAQIDRLLGGGLYINVHSDAHPPGEVRGQILPADFSMIFTDLTGRQQVPATDSLARGRAALTLDESGSATAAVHVTLFGLSNATSVRLHEGYAGTIGEPLAALSQSTTDPNHWFSNDIELDQAGHEALLAGRLYLNAGNPAFPDGLIRGQFLPEGVLLMVDELSGREEVPPVDTDASGIAALTLELDSLQYQFYVNTDSLDDADAAHIHDAYAGTNGPVLIPLQQDAMNPARWSAAGTLDQDDLEKLMAGALYVNVHSPQHPPGEIRTQLAPPGVEVLFVEMDGEQVVPPVTTAAAGMAAVTVGRSEGDVGDERQVVVHVHFSDLLMSASGGIHNAPVGENGPELFALEQDAVDVNHWFGTGLLSGTAEFEAFLADGLYVLISSVTHPDGEIRGQLVRDTPPIFPAAPTVAITAPAAGSSISGVVTVAAIVDSDLEIVAVNFLAGGVHIGSAASEPYEIEWDTTAISDGPVQLTAQAEDVLGNVGVTTPLSVTVDNAEAESMTLAEIQAQVFTPRCAICHTGGGLVLPFSMALTSAQASFDSLVNQPSEQVPGLLRVHPNDPDNSYLIHKLEGTQAVGDRMPQDGPPFLDEDLIEGIRGWIAEGAAGPVGEPAPPPPPGY